MSDRCEQERTTDMSDDIITITITEIDAPSRSKGYGWASIGDTKATRSGATRTVKAGSVVTVDMGATIRRATRTTTDRKTLHLVATGNPEDKVTASVSSPQPYAVEVTGVREATDDDLATGRTVQVGQTVTFRDSYPVKDRIKAAGGAWDSATKTWQLDVDDADAATALIAAAEAAGATVEID